MTLNPIASNMTELDLGYVRILFSYRTPVASFNRDTNTYSKTSTKWSVTTSRHIGKWVSHLLESVEWDIKPQEYFDNLVSNVKPEVK